MQVSKRILFFKSKRNGYLLFCGNSNSIYKIEEEKEIRNIKQMLNNDFSGLSKQQYIDFIKKGIIVESDDELLKQLQYQHYKILFSTNVLNLTIAPTMACNFECPYCYENRHNKCSIITDEVLYKIIAFIKNSNVMYTSLLWYGGEPLLQWEKIVFFNELCERNNLKLEQAIITNGSLLSPEIIEYIMNKEFRFIQITLDGLEKTHNRLRPMRNGNSFNTIIDNLKKLYSKMIETRSELKVIIRTNFSKINVKEYSELSIFLEQNFGDIFIFDPMFVESISCHADDSMFSWNESADILLEECKKYHLPKEKLFDRRNKLFSCGAQCSNQWVITPEGNLYKCLDDINNEDRCIGNIKENTYKNVKLITDYAFETDAFNIENCKNCLFFFSCMGGCPKKRLLGKKNCEFIKKDPKVFIEAYYEVCKYGEINI